MSHDFDQQLERLRIDTLRMFYTVRESIDKALRAARHRDGQLCQEVVDADESIDLMECQNEALGLRLLALRQPVACDLRAIMGSMRIASNLERIGDEAVNIVDRAFVLMERPALGETAEVWRLGETSLELFDKAALAFADGSFDLAQTVRQSSEATTSLHMKAFRELTEVMIRESRAVERAVQLSFISYSLKRICDRCRNISESVIFITKGLDVKHTLCSQEK